MYCRAGAGCQPVALPSCHAVRCCHNAVVTVRTVRKQGVYWCMINIWLPSRQTLLMSTTLQGSVGMLRRGLDAFPVAETVIVQQMLGLPKFSSVQFRALSSQTWTWTYCHWPEPEPEPELNLHELVHQVQFRFRTSSEPEFQIKF